MTTDPLDLRQACLDLSKAALELCDRFEEHELEAAWKGDGALVVVRMGKAYETLREFFSQQATQRLLALGIDPRTLTR